MIVDTVFSNLRDEKLDVHLNIYGEIVFQLGDDFFTLRASDAALVGKELRALSMKSAIRTKNLCEKYNARA